MQFRNNETAQRFEAVIEDRVVGFAEYRPAGQHLMFTHTEVNEALAVAKVKADQANLDKTRFLAAASHDILQPLNAARLYAASLVERPLVTDDAQLARNLDASLSAVEEIFSALIPATSMRRCRRSRRSSRR